MRLPSREMEKIKKSIRKDISAGHDVNQVFNSILTQWDINLQTHRRALIEIAHYLKKIPTPATKIRFKKNSILLRILLALLSIGLCVMDWESIKLLYSSGLPIYSLISGTIITFFFPFLYLFFSFYLRLSKPLRFSRLGWICIFDIFRFMPVLSLFLQENSLVFLITIILKIIISVQAFTISINLRNPFEYHQSYYTTSSGIRKKKLIIKFIEDK